MSVGDDDAGTRVVRSGRPDPRLLAYGAAAVAAFVGTLVTGRHELMAIGAPFAVLAAAGLAERRSPAVRAEVSLVTDRALEGDHVVGEVILDWDGEAELDVLLGPLPGVTPVDPQPALGWTLPLARGPVSLPFCVQARAWGRHQLGRLHVRSRRRLGLVVWEDDVAAGPQLRVLPGPVHLDQLLHPSQPRAVAGVHLSRLRGVGSDFADLRPYVPGDRLRDVAWAASARFGKPWVIVRHPERTGTVLLMLDASFDASVASTEALARAARAAWAVAAEHLQAQDRVGLLALGKTSAWLPPTAGRRARYMLLDELLAVGAVAEDWRARRPRGRSDVPPDALVVGISTLRSFQFSRELLRHRRSGRTTVALVVDTSDLLPPPADRLQLAAQRLWQAELDVERHRLARAGVPSALVVGDAVAPAVSALRRMTARQQAVSASGAQAATAAVGSGAGGGGGR